MVVSAQRTDHTVTAGREYLVLAMLLLPESSGLWCLIRDDQSRLTWCPTASFVTVSERIPPTWVGRIDADDGTLHLAPARWLEPGFWESYHSDGVKSREARRVFNEELAKIEQAEEHAAR